MELLWEGVVEAARLLLTLDQQVVDAAWRSIWISTVAVLVAAALGLPIGALLARRPFRGSQLVVLAARVGLATPTVLVGVLGYALFSRRGPLGPLELLFSPWGVVLGELLLALPIVISFSHAAIRSLDPRVAQTARTLGAGPWRRLWTYLSEARIGITLAGLNAFARCVTELGAALMIGGNIKDRTRTLATAIALETGKGEFAQGLAMGFVLLVIALLVTVAVALLSRSAQERSA